MKVKEMIEKTNSALKDVTKLLNENRFLFETHNLKLYGVGAITEAKILNKLNNKEKIIYNKAFEEYNDFLLHEFNYFCEESYNGLIEQTDFEDNVQYIRRTSNFYFKLSPDGAFYDANNTIFSFINNSIVLYDIFEDELIKENTDKVLSINMETVKSIFMSNKSAGNIYYKQDFENICLYIIEDLKKDIENKVNELKEIYDYIKDFKENQIENFIEYVKYALERYEENYHENINYKVNLSFSAINGGKFIGNDMNSINFHNSNFKNVEFLNCNLTNANFEECVFTNCSFEGSDLDGVNFEGAAFKNVDFLDAKITDFTNLTYCTIIDSDLSIANDKRELL